MTQTVDEQLETSQFIAASEQHPSGEGDFTPEMFGIDAVTLENRVTSWINKALNQTQVAKAQDHYVRYYGWSAAADYLASIPTMMNTDNGFLTRQRSTAQLEHFQAKADRELALAQQADAAEGEAPPAKKPRTSFIRRERTRF